MLSSQMLLSKKQKTKLFSLKLTRVLPSPLRAMGGLLVDKRDNKTGINPILPRTGWKHKNSVELSPPLVKDEADEIQKDKNDSR